jgi:hypothetical protein
MKDVLEKAQKLIYSEWSKHPNYDPLKPSKLNCSAPFFLNIIARYCYEKCVRKWRTLEITKTKLDIALVPVWICRNSSNKRKKNKWKLEILVAKSDENHVYVRDDLKPNILFVGTVEMIYMPYIEECGIISEDSRIQKKYVYGGYYVDFTIVDSQVLKVKKMCEIQPEFEKPTIYVPPMCEKIMPAVRTDHLPETLQKLLKKEFDSDCSTNKSLNWYKKRLASNDKKVLIGFNWIFRFFVAYIPTFIFITKDDTFPGANFLTLVVIVFFILVHISFKCTSTSFSRGLNFYFFKIYHKKRFRWDSYPCFDFDNLWITACIDYSRVYRGQFYRCITYNFDKLAELLSHNTHIEPYVREKLIDYVNMRKQQSVIRKILPTILFFLVLFVIFGPKCIHKF